MKTAKLNYTPQKCECCEQTTTYLLAVDHGTIDILKGFARCIGAKKINMAHIAKEVLADGYITVNQRGNVSRPRAHGLIAKVRGELGNYLLTTKGAQFLKGNMRIPKYAIMNKVTGHQVGYFEPEKYTVGVHDFKGEYWEGINYEIQEGRIIEDLPGGGQQGVTVPLFHE